MKKWISFVLLFALGLSPLAAAEEAPAFAALTGLDRAQQKISGGAAITRVYYTDGYGFSSSEFTTDDPEEIRALWDALCEMTLGDKVSEAITDWYPQIVCYFSDGEVFRVCFDAHWLEIGGMEHYEVGNADAFWQLTAGLVEKHAQGETLPGGWTVSGDYTVTDEARRIFEEGLQGLPGAGYAPVAYLGSQTVAGTNHCFLARAKAAYPDAEPYYALIYLYESLSGQVEILDIRTLDFGALCRYGVQNGGGTE